MAADAPWHARWPDDDEAVRDVVDGRLDRVAALDRRMLGDAAYAEDVAQETFVRFWREAARWRAGVPITRWLFRVAHNLCLDRLRRRRWQAAPPYTDLADPAPEPDDALDRERVATVVRAAIAALPERQRTAITLAYDLQLDNGTAAAIMDVSVEALESLLARARRSLRDRLGDQRLIWLEALP
ncbi:MAG: sigma-70 family RNA polymerase sigma factor [Alphaproteobacteria bacterium]|nr:sigma-70 family RNA polymerase sigma factor [Alphaproteobacteria bacterium]